MYLMNIIDRSGAPVFILVLPFEKKHLASQGGFTWDKIQPGAWATDQMRVATEFMRNHANVITVAADTLKLFFQHEKILPTTFDRFMDKVNAFEPDKKMQAGIYAAKMTTEQVTAVHQAVKNLASVCDGSLRDDHAGFNRNDVEFGHNMADLPQLSRGQAAHCKMMLRKYRGQIGDDLYSVIFPNQFAREQHAERLKVAKKAAKSATSEANKAAKKAKHNNCVGCGHALDQHSFSDYTGLVHCNVMLPMGENGERQCGCQNYKTIEQHVADDLQIPVEQLKKVIELPASTVANTFPDEAELEPAAQKVYDELLPKPTMPVGRFDVVQNIAQVTEPAAVVTVVKSAFLSDDQQKADPEIIKLAISLIDCFAGDFDTTVDMLRDLRGIDEPKKAGSDFTAAAWAGAGYKVVK